MKQRCRITELKSVKKPSLLTTCDLVFQLLYEKVQILLLRLIYIVPYMHTKHDTQTKHARKQPSLPLQQICTNLGRNTGLKRRKSKGKGEGKQIKTSFIHLMIILISLGVLRGARQRFVGVFYLVLYRSYLTRSRSHCHVEKGLTDSCILIPPLQLPALAHYLSTLAFPRTLLPPTGMLTQTLCRAHSPTLHIPLLLVFQIVIL